MTEEKKSVDSLEEQLLPNKKVTLVPVIRDGGWLPKGHDGEFMYSGTMFSIDLPLSKSGGFVRILNADEERFFSARLGEDLSFHKRNLADTFWARFRINIRKDDGLMMNGITYDLSNPIDNLRVRILKVHPSVAPSWESRFDRGEYRFALVDQDYKIDERVKRVTLKQEAYEHLGKIRHSEKKLSDFLRVYYANRGSGKKVSHDMKKDALNAEVGDILESDLDGFLNVVGDADYEMKVFIEDAVLCGALIRDGKAFIFPESREIIGSTLTSTVDALKRMKSKTDDVYLMIKAKVDSAQL